MPQASAISLSEVLSPDEAKSAAAVSRISVLRDLPTDTTFTPKVSELTAATVQNVRAQPARHAREGLRADESPNAL